MYVFLAYMQLVPNCCYVNVWCILSCARLSNGVRLLIIGDQVFGELSQFYRGGFNIGQVGIALPSSHQLDKAVWNISLSCCGGCSDAEAVGVVFAGVNL